MKLFTKEYTSDGGNHLIRSRRRGSVHILQFASGFKWRGLTSTATRFLAAFVLISIARPLPAATIIVGVSSNSIGFSTNGPVRYEIFRITQLMSNTLPQHPRAATNAGYRRMFPSEYIYTNAVFHSLSEDSLNYCVWTNFLAHTNGRDMVIWSQRSHPNSWPTNPPVVTWNKHSLIWGMKGMTALSPCWAGEGGHGQVPLTALTRRHAYTRGHGMGADGFNTYNARRKAWFVAADNSLVEAIIKRQVTRATASTNGEHRDYTILMFDRDLPSSIEPMAVADSKELQRHYPFPTLGNVPHSVFQTEQGGRVSSGVPPLTVNTWKGGDSGSPNMLPLPGELIFFSGRSTSGPTLEMQRDIDELCRQEKVDAVRYQLRWTDLSKFPAY